MFERRLGAAPLFQVCEDAFDVLACAKRVGGEVAAGAGVFAQAVAADDDGVRALALRVADEEFGKDRIAADIFDVEVLGATVFAAQGDLPIFQRHAVGSFRA